MGVSQIRYGQTQALDAGGLWVARGIYAEDDERHLVPIGLEVRPAGLAEGGWPPLPDSVDRRQLPPSGLPLGLLRSTFRWQDRRESLDQVVNLSLGEVSLGELFELGLEALIQHLEKVAEVAVQHQQLRPGRRDLARSLFTLIEAADQRSPDRRPRARQEIVRAVQRAYPDFTDTELRSTVQWGRRHQPPLFLPHGPRQRGGRLTKFTERVLILLDPETSLDDYFLNELRRDRARELPEFDEDMQRSGG